MTDTEAILYYLALVGGIVMVLKLLFKFVVGPLAKALLGWWDNYCLNRRPTVFSRIVFVILLILAGVYTRVFTSVLDHMTGGALSHQAGMADYGDTQNDRYRCDTPWYLPCRPE